jgi:predicted amidophosphoribosyltransferase
VLFPVRCAICDRIGASPCGSCVADLERAPPQPVPLGLDDCWSLLSYEGPARDLVARVKYRNVRGSVPWLAEAMAGLVPPGTVEVVTWAPTAADRRRRRGFDHAAVLSAAVARRLGVAHVGLLARGPGPAQTGQGREVRRRGPALAPTPAVGRWSGATVAVVDDVLTTGGSLTAAARALRAGGVGAVVGLVAARTPRHPTG